METVSLVLPQHVNPKHVSNTVTRQHGKQHGTQHTHDTEHRAHDTHTQRLRLRDSHLCFRAAFSRIAWTPFTGTGGSREPPVPHCVLSSFFPNSLDPLHWDRWFARATCPTLCFRAAISGKTWIPSTGTGEWREPLVPHCVFEQL